MRILSFSICFLLLFSCQSLTEDNNTLFKLLSAKETGIDFANNLTYTVDFNPYIYRNFFNGGGVALGDINNDGLVDIYFTGNMVDNKLYLNKGNFKFEDITQKAGVSCSNVWSSGASMIDINGDGWLDIYVCKSGKPDGEKRYNELFINNKNGTFTEQAKKYGLDIVGLSVQASFFDFDKDGDLDMYLLNNSIRPVGQGMDLIIDKREEFSNEGNKFFINDKGYFKDFSKEAGIYTSEIGFGLGVTLEDFNQDGWVDIFVSNDFFERDYLYLNNQHGGFHEVATNYFSSFSKGSMGADAADMDNDLLPDLFVTEMLPATFERKKTKAIYDSWDKYSLALKKGYSHQYPRNVFQRNMGHAGFFEIGRMSNIAATEWSWAALMFDMDNDGLRDIFISNGIYKDLLDRDYLTFSANEQQIINTLKANKKEGVKKLIDIMPSKALPNFAYKNEGNFVMDNKSEEWGLDTPSFSNGSAYADLDNDGDLDLIVNNVNMPSFVYENTTKTTERKYISISLVNDDKNTAAIGSKVILKTKDNKNLIAFKSTSKGFQSSINTPIHFGLGEVNLIDTLIVKWPDGSITEKVNVKVNTHYEITKDKNKVNRSILKEATTEILRKETSLFNYQHEENDFIDFNLEPLLPQMFSNEGPAFAFSDINNDGKEDYYIGGAKGKSGTLYLSQNNVKYKEYKSPFELDKESEDIQASFIDVDNDGDSDLVVASGGKAFSVNSTHLKDRIYINQGKGVFKKKELNFPFTNFSSSVVAPTDYDKDGDIDFFIGERYKTDLYGFPCSGYLINNTNENYSLEQEEIFNRIGLITDANWSDINNDGWEDLIIAGEWMPIKIFINNKGILKDSTEEYGLDKTSGFWNVLKVIDIDNDGDNDILAGNLGKNNFFKDKMKVYVNDFDQNGTVEQIFCYSREGGDYPILDRDELLSQMPYLKKEALYYKQYASMSMKDLFTPEVLNRSLIGESIFTETTLFINNNEKGFTPYVLPKEIQYSSVYTIETKDINNDGILDIFAGGNQRKIKPQFGSQDASKGWYIEGKIEGNKYIFSTPKSLNIEGQIRKLHITKEGKTLITIINNEKAKFYEIN